MPGLETGGAMTGVSYHCNNNNGQECVVETVFGNNDSELGSFVGVNFADCTPPWSMAGLWGRTTENALLVVRIYLEQRSPVLKCGF